ncbi:MAG: hypothetical protein RSA17_06210, partial [Ruthenibacterium sp.]
RHVCHHDQLLQHHHYSGRRHADLHNVLRLALDPKQKQRPVTAKKLAAAGRCLLKGTARQTDGFCFFTAN